MNFNKKTLEVNNCMFALIHNIEIIYIINYHFKDEDVLRFMEDYIPWLFKEL